MVHTVLPHGLVGPAFAAGLVGRFVEPFSKLFRDLVSLDPELAQLVAFGLLLGGVYALAALGMTIIFGVMDVINFAHGVFMTIGIYTVWLVSTSLHVSPFLAFPVAVLALFVIGVASHKAVIEPVVNEPGQTQLLVTFGLVLVFQNVLQILFSPNPQSLKLSLGKVSLFGVSLPYGQLYALVIAVISVMLVWALLYRTRVGRAIRATADNRSNSPLVGINVPRVNYLTFGLGAGLAGLAGATISLFRLFDPFIGTSYLIFVFVIVVLGGLGSIPGALVGGIIIGLVQVFASFYTHGSTYKVVIMLIFIGVLLVKPEGLFGGATQ